MANIKRESFIVYRSFYALIKLLKPKEQLKMFQSIFDYGFDGTEPNFGDDDTSKAIWLAVLPQLKANQRRYENGLKGGAPEGNKNAQKETTEKQPNGDEKNNQKPTKKTTEKQPNENVNVNVNDNLKESMYVKEREDKIYARARVPYDKILDDFGVEGEYREAIFRFIKHLKASFGIVVINDRLENLIVKIDLKYREERDKVKAIDEAIVKGYKRLDCEIEGE